MDFPERQPWGNLPPAMRQRCDICGVDSIEGQVFAQESIPFRRTRRYCAVCHDRLHRRIYAVLIYGALVVALSALVYWLFKPESEGARHWIGIGLFQLLLIIATVWHELGHALAARCQGLKVRGIIIGLGKTWFTSNLTDIKVVVRVVPVGGLTFVDPVVGSSPWRKHFVLTVCGPLANAVVVGAGALMLPAGSWLGFGSFDRADPLGLFVLANLVLVVESLIPLMYSTPYGVLLSDGLSLYQLLFLRRLPFIPETSPHSHRSPDLRWLIFPFVACCALVCFGIAGLVIVVPGAAPSERGFVAGLFLVLGIVMSWMSYRATQKPTSVLTAGRVSSGPYSYQPILDAWMRELDAERHWPADRSRELEGARITAEADAGNTTVALQMVDDLLARAPESLLAAVWKAQLLHTARRYQDAVSAYASLLARNGLNSPVRTVLLGELLKSGIHLGEFDAARARMTEFLDSSTSTLEKSYVLDCLACFPFSEEERAYLSEADHWSELACRLQPGSLTLKGTRGAVLTELGRFDEAEPLLQEVYQMAVDDNDRGISALYLALQAKTYGDLIKATRMARTAKQLHPSPWLAKRVAREFGL